jgi:RES domain
VPPTPPPTSAVLSLNLRSLEAGSLLWRVHPAAHAATDFKAKPSDDLFGGGRFDGTAADPYPFLYAAHEPETALLETLVRAIPFNDHGHRWVRRVAVAGRRASAVRVTRTLSLVSLLTHADLAAACQDEWLVQADPSEYPWTRRWGSWLRSHAATADGFVWPSRRNLGHEALVLFGDRGDGSLVLADEPAVDLGDGDGAAWLNHRLAPYRIRITPPTY